MQPNFELVWRRARALENEGQPAAAKAIYESLIAEDPERLYVRLRLSAIEQGEGNYRASRMHAVRCAETVRSSRWKDLAPVTRRLLDFDERKLVRDLIRGTDWRHPEILKSSAVLSQHLWLVGEVGEALRLMDIALARSQPSTVLGYSRANALRYLGRMAEATAEYERCLGIDARDPYVHWSLAYHEKAKPPGSRIARIEKARTAFGEEGEEQAFLHYALFKEHEDAGHTEQAWRHLTSGAAIRRKAIRYDAALEQQGFDTLREIATREFVARKASPPTQGFVPIFILGMPRSGTTLLERIIGGHSAVTPAGELNDFNSALSLESNQFFPPFVAPKPLERLRDIDFGNVGRCYLQRAATWAQARPYMVDKNPANFTNAGFIAKALPQARILCLRRNPMDACLSNLKVLFTSDAFGYSYRLDELADYYIRFDQLSRHWREVLGEQYLEVDYEQLVADPHAMAERVMSFCGLRFEPESVDITRNETPVTTASSSQVRQPINARGIGAWRRYADHLEPLRMRLESSLGPLH